MDNFTQSWKNQIAIPTNSRTAGTSNINGPSTDLFGFNCAVLMIEMGAIAATAVTKIKVQDSDDGSTWADLADAEITVAADDDNDVFMLELTHPLERYVRAVVERGTANATVAAGRWFLGHSYAEPVSQPSDVQTLLVH
jgi:hypothetical protein